MPPRCQHLREGQPGSPLLLFTAFYALGHRCLYRFSSFRGARFQFLLLLRWRKSLRRHRFFFCVLLRFRRRRRPLRSAIVWRSFFFEIRSTKIHVRDDTTSHNFWGPGKIRNRTDSRLGTTPLVVEFLHGPARPYSSTFSRNHSPGEKCPPRRCVNSSLGFSFFPSALFAPLTH